MGFTCCVPGCRTGYKLRKSERKTFVPKVSVFKIPREPTLRRKWLEAIPRGNRKVTDTCRVCALHFSLNDFLTDSIDSNNTRRCHRKDLALARARLKADAVPHIFNGLSANLSLSMSIESRICYPPLNSSMQASALSHLIPVNSSSSGIIFHRLANSSTPDNGISDPRPSNFSILDSAIKRHRPVFSTDNGGVSHRLDNTSPEESLLSDISEVPEAETISQLKEKIYEVTLPSGYTLIPAKDSLQFHFIETTCDAVSPPKLAISVRVTECMEVFAFVKSKPVPKVMYEDVLPSGFVQSATDVVNVLTLCKKLYTSGADAECINLAVALLEDHLASKTDGVTLGQDRVSLLRFIVEQLRLVQIQPTSRRFSSETLINSFLWSLASPALYKDLKRFFALPTMSQLRQLSYKIPAEPGIMDIEHIREHAMDLGSCERIVCLLVEEIDMADRLEYANDSFNSSLDEDRPTKTVLAFTVQSLYSKYKDVACLVPLEKLDIGVLHLWFEIVMQALDEFFMVVAVSIGNRACSRKLFVELCGGVLRSSIEHPTRVDEQLFLIFDFTDTLINIYKDFVSKKRISPPTAGHENILGASSVAEFKHVLKLYELEEDSMLENESLNPSNTARSTPLHALSVFSNSTVQGLEAFGEEMYPEFVKTARFVKFIKNIWTIMSVNSTVQGVDQGDMFSMPLHELEEGHPAEKYLRQAIAIFEEWQQSGRTGLTSETFTACIQTMTAVIALSKYLQYKHGVKYFLTGKLMSDPNDSRFGVFQQVAR